MSIHKMGLLAGNAGDRFVALKIIRNIFGYELELDSRYSGNGRERLPWKLRMLGVRGLGPRFLSKPREQLLLLLVLMVGGFGTRASSSGCRTRLSCAVASLGSP